MRSQRYSRIDAMLNELVNRMPEAESLMVLGISVFIVRGIHNTPRAFARCRYHLSYRVHMHVEIELATELEREPLATIRGVIAHEIAHAIEFLSGDPLPDDLDDLERRTDMVAEQLFGEPIYYDDRMVQCMGKGARGTRPRPDGLR